MKKLRPRKVNRCPQGHRISQKGNPVVSWPPEGPHLGLFPALVSSELMSRAHSPGPRTPALSGYWMKDTLLCPKSPALVPSWVMPSFLATVVECMSPQDCVGRVGLQVPELLGAPQEEAAWGRERRGSDPRTASPEAVGSELHLTVQVDSVRGGKCWKTCCTFFPVWGAS